MSKPILAKKMENLVKKYICNMSLEKFKWLSRLEYIFLKKASKNATLMWST